ncbi:MAG: 16S rRNA (adenine(1518)-N(6)/adenine(1519)-N(6))-dimethyltransferase RsmA [Erysipelotrichaceae bacterium]|nr:16S rRNA (adenine(1518)-N(6)/adenine(1519)-N(6))-dimethyltransferase RsmA [Erysipelotrichaceae bacterium]MDY5253011.1 16S rRNA (adenine(1518)-N(6)/adenine(1519)-N(6))-dimethyltransferase RsmA [Erysipelotrichaceae bacterium]
MKIIASVARTNEILEKFDLRAKKGYGQNFLTDSNIVANIADKADCQDGCVIEIGPGIGALTQMLAQRAKFVLAYEIDTKLLDVLAYSLADLDNVKIINEDFLNCELASVVKTLKEQYGKVVVCANLPYYITTPILFKLFECEQQVDKITVMMQKEVADRFSAKVNSKDYNALSVMSQYLYDVKTIIKVSRNVFNPKPNVDSAVVQFSQHQRPAINDQAAFFALVKASFKQRRKTLYNNLREYLQDGPLVEKILADCQLSNKARAQELSLEQFIQLYERYDHERKSVCKD